MFTSAVFLADLIDKQIQKKKKKENIPQHLVTIVNCTG